MRYSAIFKIKLNFAKGVCGLSKGSADAFHRAPGWPLWHYRAPATEISFYSPDDLFALHPIEPPELSFYIVRPHFDLCQGLLPLSLGKKHDSAHCSYAGTEAQQHAYA